MHTGEAMLVQKVSNYCQPTVIGLGRGTKQMIVVWGGAWGGFDTPVL